MKLKFKLGSTVVEKITGFEGVLTGVARYLTGCDQYLLQPPSKEGAYVKGEWFDEGRLKIKEAKIVKKKDVKAHRGNGACGIAPIK